MRIGNNLKSRRVKAGFSQKEVAKYMCFSPSVIQEWEENIKQPTVGQLIILANLYACKMPDFLKGVRN